LSRGGGTFGFDGLLLTHRQDRRLPSPEKHGQQLSQRPARAEFDFFSASFDILGRRRSLIWLAFRGLRPSRGGAGPVGSSHVCGVALRAPVAAGLPVIFQPGENVGKIAGRVLVHLGHPDAPGETPPEPCAILPLLLSVSVKPQAMF
jgi:hypothetical protein